MIILNEINGLLTVEEEEELNRQFVRDNFCPSDKDPLTYEYEESSLMTNI